MGGASQITVVEPDAKRRVLVKELMADPQFLDHVAVVPGSDGFADGCINSLEVGSLIINATGMGKDREGSPVSCDFLFPSEATVWDFNYRGELGFLRHASEQAVQRGLRVYDGFDYFASGWSVVTSRVAGLPWNHEVFRRFLNEAAASR